MGLIKDLMIEIAETAYPGQVNEQSHFYDLCADGMIPLWDIHKGGLVINKKRFVWDKQTNKLKVIVRKSNRG